MAVDNDVSKFAVLKLLKKEKYHPYKIQLVQELNDDDPDRRLQFCETIMNLHHANERFHHQIVFSDEATFCINGTVGRTAGIGVGKILIGWQKHTLNSTKSKRLGRNST